MAGSADSINDAEPQRTQNAHVAPAPAALLLLLLL
jgi:hypothetical protein